MSNELKEIKVIFQIMEILSQNNCSAESIERILHNIKFAIRRYLTLQDQNMSLESVTNLFTNEIGYERHL